jgi:hypothetical protein
MRKQCSVLRMQSTNTANTTPVTDMAKRKLCFEDVPGHMVTFPEWRSIVSRLSSNQYHSPRPSVHRWTNDKENVPPIEPAYFVSPCTMTDDKQQDNIQLTPGSIAANDTPASVDIKEDSFTFGNASDGPTSPTTIVCPCCFATVELNAGNEVIGYDRRE